jgi:hypothetical protein
MVVLFMIFQAASGLLATQPSGTPGSTSKPSNYSFMDCELAVSAPVMIGRAKGRFYFPSFHPLNAEEIICSVTLCEDKAQGQWPAALYLSQDGGASWRPAGRIDSCSSVSLSLGNHRILIMPFELRPASPGNMRDATAEGTLLALNEKGTFTTERVPIKYFGFPRDLERYYIGELYLLTDGNILPLHDGRLFATVYGKGSGDTKDSTWSVTSEDRGRTWRFQATVASGPELSQTQEGANESNTIRLADDRLMCVYRTGSSKDYHKSYSRDEGSTWTKPERMEGVFSVEPRLTRLANGVILLSGGRPGLYVWICTDGLGNRWQRFNLAEHHNKSIRDSLLRYDEQFCKGGKPQPDQSTSYTDIASVGSNEVIVCYDRLANGSDGAPGPWGQWDVVFCVRLRVLVTATE